MLSEICLRGFWNFANCTNEQYRHSIRTASESETNSDSNNTSDDSDVAMTSNNESDSNSDTENASANADGDDAMDDGADKYGYEVEDIIGHKFKNGKKYFKIRWKNRDADQDTWEPEKDLTCVNMIKRYLGKHVGAAQAHGSHRKHYR